MTLFIASFTAIVLAGLGMGIGLFLNRKPLCGSCAQLGQIEFDGGSGCAGCAYRRDEDGKGGRKDE